MFVDDGIVISRSVKRKGEVVRVIIKINFVACCNACRSVCNPFQGWRCSYVHQ